MFLHSILLHTHTHTHIQKVLLPLGKKFLKKAYLVETCHWWKHSNSHRCSSTSVRLVYVLRHCLAKFITKLSITLFLLRHHTAERAHFNLPTHCTISSVHTKRIAETHCLSVASRRRLFSYSGWNRSPCEGERKSNIKFYFKLENYSFFCEIMKKRSRSLDQK